MTAATSSFGPADDNEGDTSIENAATINKKLNPLQLTRRLFAWFKEGISPKARILIIVFLLIFSAGSLFAAYKVNDYFENNPQACFSCHDHDEANKAWVVSEHAGINCHECHHSTKADQIRQLFNFAVLGHNKVLPRHGEVIVPWKLCFGCHWERNEKGQFVPKEVPGTEQVRPVQLVLLAMGFLGPEQPLLDALRIEKAM